MKAIVCLYVVVAGVEDAATSDGDVLQVLEVLEMLRLLLEELEVFSLVLNLAE